MIVNLINYLKSAIIGLLIFATVSIAHADMWEYIVIKGDTLWDVADDNFIDVLLYQDLQKLNKVENPYILQPGRKIIAPSEWLNNIPGKAKLLSKTGSVRLFHSDGTKKESKLKTIIYSDDTLVTNSDSTATVEFSDRTRVKIYPNSKVLFKTVNQSLNAKHQNLRLFIQKGRIQVEANPDEAPNNRLEIETPSAVTAVRGTVFRVGFNEDSDSTVVETLSGRVNYVSGNTDIDLEQGFGIKTLSQGNTIAPVKLLPAPIIVAKQTHENKLGSIKWTKSDQATKYRIKVSSVQDFTDIIYDKVVQTDHVNDIYFNDNGIYYASIRSVDSYGIEGFDGLTELDVQIYPLAPLVMFPKNQDVLKTLKPKFSWKNLNGKVNQIRFQLARDVKFKSILIDEIFESNKKSFRVREALEKGNYFWRLAGIDEQGQGSYSSSYEVILE